MCTCCNNTSTVWATPVNSANRCGGCGGYTAQTTPYSTGCGGYAAQTTPYSTGCSGYGVSCASSGCFGRCSSQFSTANATGFSGDLYVVKKVNGCCGCPYAQTCRRHCGCGFGNF